MTDVCLFFLNTSISHKIFLLFIYLTLNRFVCKITDFFFLPSQKAPQSWTYDFVLSKSWDGKTSFSNTSLERLSSFEAVRASHYFSMLQNNVTIFWNTLDMELEDTERTSPDDVAPVLRADTNMLFSIFQMKRKKTQRQRHSSNKVFLSQGAPKRTLYKYVRCNPNDGQANCVTYQTPEMPWNPDLPSKLPASTAQYL